MTYFMQTTQSEILKTAGGCFVCKKTEDNYILFGEIFTKSNISVHLYCLLFSKNLIQMGEEKSGIQRFLINDIRKLMLNESKTICCYCNQPSATLHCCYTNDDGKSDCARQFHLFCGYENNAHFECMNYFNTYCHKHVNIIDKHKPSTADDSIKHCLICYESIGEYNPVKHIPSCCSLCWLHVNCLRHYAYHSGYGFRCIACRSNCEEYKVLVRKRGIFIPLRDSTWEKDKNAFRYLLNRHSTCDATTCLCNFGREYNKGMWHIMLCEVCAAFGTHSLCRENVHNENEFKCKNCQRILNKKLNSYIQTVSNTLFDSLFDAQSQEEDIYSNSLQEISVGYKETNQEIRQQLSLLKMIKLVHDASQRK